MKAVFVDTAGWMACADGNDLAHNASCEARDALLESGHVLITTDYVMDETLTLLRMRLGLAVAKAWWELVKGSTRVKWEWIGMERAEKARTAFFRYRDKQYSFTDCTSFVVMQDLKIKQALTTDHHFRQMGFQMLPKNVR